ncbi:Sua5/YciO/YrdC/YwlC family protein [Shigella flexneri]
MLPANPLQHLLLQELQCPLAMTSGNLSGNHRLSATNRRWRICRALPTDSST